MSGQLADINLNLPSFANKDVFSLLLWAPFILLMLVKWQ